MRIIEVNCKNCGQPIQFKNGEKFSTCKYCRSNWAIDESDEIHSVTIDNAEDAGYKFEKGRMKAQEEAEKEAK